MNGHLRCLLFPAISWIAVMAIVLGSTFGVVADEKPDSTPAKTPTATELVRLIRDSAKAKEWARCAESIHQLGELKPTSTAAHLVLIEQLAITEAKVTVRPWTADVAFFAQRALEQCGPAICPQLMQVGLKHKNIYVRQKSAELLGKFRFEKAIDRLIECLGDPYYGVASAASTALAKIGHRAAEPLIKIIQKSISLRQPATSKTGQGPDPIALRIKQRNYAVGVLGKLNVAESVQPVIAALATDDELLRKWAAHALSAMRSVECRKELSKSATVTQLLKALEDDVQPVRSAASMALVNVGEHDPESFELILDAFGKLSPKAKTHLFFTLAFGNPDRRAVPIILRCLQTDNLDEQTLKDRHTIGMRRAALSALDSHLRLIESADEIEKTVVASLKDLSPVVREAAASTILRCIERWTKDRRWTLALVEALKDETQPLAEKRLVQVLGATGDPRAVDPLLVLLAAQPLVAQKNGSLCAELCRALSELSDDRSIAILRKRMKLEEPFVIEAIGKFGDVDSVPQLIGHIKTGSPERRLAAVKALAAKPDLRAIEALQDLLDELVPKDQFVGKNRDLIREVSQALAATRDARAVEHLLATTRTKLAEDDRFGNPENAELKLETSTYNDPRFQALSRLGPTVVPLLIKELQRPHRNPMKLPAGNESTVWSRRVAISVISSDMARFREELRSIPFLEATLLLSLDDPDGGVVFHAIRCLGRMQSKNALPKLLAMTRIPFAGEAAKAVQGVDDKKQSGPAVVGKPKIHDDIREELLIALNSIDPHLAASEFARHMEHPAAEIRSHAIPGLVRSKHPRTIALLTKALDDESVSVRQMAARFMGHVGDTKAVEPLQKLLSKELERPPVKRNNSPFWNQREPITQVVEFAINSLGMLNAQSASDSIFNVTKKMTGFDKADRLAIRMAASVALMQVQDERGLDLFREVLKADEKNRANCLNSVWYAVWESRNGKRPAMTFPENAIQLLRTTALDDASGNVRGTAMRILSQFPSPQTEHVLQKGCQDPEVYVRPTAVMSLFEIKSKSAWTELGKLAQSSEEYCRASAARLYVDQIKVSPSQERLDDATDELRRLLKDNSTDVRKACVDRLEELVKSHPGQVERLRKELLRMARADKSESIRKTAQSLLRLLKAAANNR